MNSATGSLRSTDKEKYGSVKSKTKIEGGRGRNKHRQ